MCAELLPEVIELDDWGYPIVRGGLLPEDLRDLAERAVEVCRCSPCGWSRLSACALRCSLGLWRRTLCFDRTEAVDAHPRGRGRPRTAIDHRVGPAGGRLSG